MNNPLIDVEIYLYSFKEILTTMYSEKEFLEEYGIEDSDKMIELALDEVRLFATDNFNQNGDPTLTEIQYLKALNAAITSYHLESLQDKGLIESVFDETDSEIKYRLTEFGTEIGSQINNSNASLN